jgi:eukaryotic-like serine/threonine-protein kinase
MTLASGTKLGPYEIVGPLGAGGMGEVYRAKDTRLDRTVAIKILPAHLSSDPVRKQRFEREAKTISSLNHPHICVLHDVGQQDEIDYLVMECVEGETLAKRLEKGAIPLAQVLKYGRQIADALDTAHRCGVVHRDLKPGNIMLTPTGAKLLDFGLAKPAAPLSSTVTVTEGTRNSPMTEQGTIVGTFPYMSPEQIEGKELDGRSDIFSLGAVLYEMLTGQRAFEGQSQLSVASAILEKEPVPISKIKPLTPPAFEHVVRTCLGKSPDDRFQSARDVRLELQWIDALGSQADIPAPVVVRRRNHERLAWAAFATVAVATLTLAIVHFRESPAEQALIRLSVLPPDGATFSDPTLTGFTRSTAAISPDGQRLALVVTVGGRRSIWVRRLDSLTAQPLPGTEGADGPFWSPDSRYIAFFAERKLKKIEASGGPAVTLCDAPVGWGGTWSRNGVIAFNPFSGPLYGVPAEGGACTQFTTLDLSGAENNHGFPQFLPDGRHFLYVSYTKTGNDEIYVDSLDSKLGSKNRKPLVSTNGEAVYTPVGGGYLLFNRADTLMAQRFNSDRLELSGEPLSVTDPEPGGFGRFSVSTDGVLVYWAGASAKPRLIWFDRAGKQLGTVGAPGDDWFSLSPDGKRVAVRRGSANTDIWLLNLARGTASRLTFDSADDGSPIWSPDGSRIVFHCTREGKPSICQKASSGVGNEEVLLKSDEYVSSTDWSSDGRFLLLGNQTPKKNWELRVLPLEGDRKPFPFLHRQFNDGWGKFSPDGRWVAYASDEAGRREIYVQPFHPSLGQEAATGPGGKWQISTEGGDFPSWRRDGKELFYIAPDHNLMAVQVKTEATEGRPALEAGVPRTLFDTGTSEAILFPYAATADGQRFLINTVAAGEQKAQSLTVVVNWVSGLKK